MGDGDAGESASSGQRGAASPFVAGLVSLLVTLAGQRYAEPLRALRAEKHRLLRGAFLGVGVVFFSAMGLATLSFGVIAVFWRHHRLLALAGVITFYWMLAALFFWRWRLAVRQGSLLFRQREKALRGRP